MRKSVGLLLAMSLSIPVSGAAQEALNQGDFVRLTGIDRTRVTGFVTEMTAGALSLDGGPDGALVAKPWSEILRVERSLGSQRNFAKHFLVTLAVSAGGIGVLAFAAHSDDDCTGFCIGPDSRAEAFLWGAFGGGLIGVPLGVVLGLVIKSQRWAPVATPPLGDLRFSVGPTSRGFEFVGSVPVGR